MKYHFLTALALVACPFLSNAQTKLAGKIFKPVVIECNGQKQTLAADSIPFSMEFIDDKNIVYKEMKENYYVLHHCVYTVKKNSLEIEFLRKNRPALVYQIQSSDEQKLQLKDQQNNTIFLNKTRD